MELLVVLSIIALLVGLLIPAFTVVQRSAREAKQQAQFTAIDLALTAYKNDFGDYPPSELSAGHADYCGAQKLTEALLGWDLLGFHPRSNFRSNGYNDDGVFVYDADDSVLFDQRKRPYLDLAGDNVFRLGNMTNVQGLFNDTGYLAPETYVICDVFGFKKVKLINGKAVNAGAPILYYKANESETSIDKIYNPFDNDILIQVKEQADNRGDGWHPLGVANNNYEFFYNYIRDPKRDARVWPYRADSYILISAGADGRYGTSDDIRNFGN